MSRRRSESGSRIWPLARRNPPRRTSTSLRQLRFESLECRCLLAASSIQIFAAGETGEEILDLQIDGFTVATFANVGGDTTNRVFETFDYTHPTQVTIDQIRLAYSNDAFAVDGADRNLRIDKLVLDGVVYETEAPSTFSIGTWDPIGGCGPGTKESEFLHCNGFFQYAAFSTGSTIEIFAAGTVGTEQMQLWIDDVTVATFDNVGGDAVNGVFQTFSYTHPTEVTVDRIQVAFTNDGTDPVLDQNLRVDRITLDGVNFESEDPSTFSTGTWDAVGGCSEGNKQSEFLHCDGFFQYGAPSSGTSLIVIEAAGGAGSEIMELQIDGSSVATFSDVGGDIDTGLFQTFQYEHSSPVSISQIRVALINDSAAVDRTLRVDALTLGGVRYETEAASTHSTGTWDPTNGCSPGNKQSEFLHCNGYFQYAPSEGNHGVLALGTALLTVNELDGTVTIPVVRTGGTDGIVSLNYTTVDSTAIAGQDYIANSGQAVFQDGQTETSIVVSILNDDLEEGTEFFNVASDQTTGGATVGHPRTATITLIDDESPPSPGTGNGLLGEYFHNIDLTGLELERNDATIDFVWGFGGPVPQIGGDTFSARWTGQIEPLFSETYTFTAEVDDGFRLWIDDQLIIDSWVDQATVLTGQAALQANQRHDIRIEYFENLVGATVILRWDSASQALEVVPQSQLYSLPASNVDGSFSGQTIVSGLSSPTAIGFGPNGEMFISEQRGVVRVYKNGQLLPQPFIDITAEVNHVQDRGLIGIAVHPDFPNQPYVYLSYTYDPPETAGQTGLAGPDGAGNRVARMTRITADASTGFTTAVPGSEVVVLGTNSTYDNISFPDQDSTNNINLPPSCGHGGTLHDCLPIDSRSHTISGIGFGPDGMLYVANGDGTSFGQVDPRTSRVQDLDSLSGKLLRLDPDTFLAPSDNPFFNGDPSANRSKVYSYGLRNPFRFAFRPEDGEPYIADVGWNTWEEVNTGRGANFGWPYYEGTVGQNLQTGGYSSLPEAQAFYASNPNVTPPIYSRSHLDGATAMVVGDFYTGSLYPDALQNALFVTDLADGITRALRLNPDGSVRQALTLDNGVGVVVHMKMHPLDGHLYYTDILGRIGRLVFTPDSLPGSGGGGGGSNGGSGSAAFADFDSDADTDGTDFLAWQLGFGKTTAATITDGDANGDGAVDQTDLQIWETNFSGAPASADLVALASLSSSMLYTQADPEPAEVMGQLSAEESEIDSSLSDPFSALPDALSASQQLDELDILSDQDGEAQDGQQASDLALALLAETDLLHWPGAL